MYHVLFWSLFSGNVVLAIYLALNPRMHSQPWRLLLLGFLSWTLVFWLQDSVESLAKFIGDSEVEKLRSGVSLLATAVSAMVGAIFGAAIANRAKLLNEKEIGKIMARLSQAESAYRLPAEEIYAKLTDQTQPVERDEFLRLHGIRAELLARYHCEVVELRDGLRELSP